MACISKSNIHSGIEHRRHVGAGRRGTFPRRRPDYRISRIHRVGVVLCFNARIREKCKGFFVALTELPLIACNTTIRCNP
jgi:hypothetical protein